MAEDKLVKKANWTYGVPFSRSKVDIIIPFHGCYEKVSRLITSILLATRSNPYQICLVDDCSPNKNFIDELKNVPQVFAMRTEKQLGFGGALELGFNATHQPWVVFLHSDCVVEDPRWLIEMGRSLIHLKEQGVRMVSARTNNPGEGGERLKARRSDISNDVILKEGFLPLFCSMCHRELFSHIGGFIKNYYPARYEDEELAYRMRYFGFLQGICGKSWVKHDGGATMGMLCKDEKIAAMVDANREQCIKDIQNLYSKKK